MKIRNFSFVEIAKINQRKNELNLIPTTYLYIRLSWCHTWKKTANMVSMEIFGLLVDKKEHIKQFDKRDKDFILLDTCYF